MDRQIPQTPGNQMSSQASIDSPRRRNPTESDVDESGAILARSGGMSESCPERPTPSMTGSSSWDSVSEGEDRGWRSLRPDRRKTIDTTTPTLVDEEDEDVLVDEEIVSYERQGHDQPKSDGSISRGTPGSNLKSSAVDPRSASLRRTPGATAMHRSAIRNPVAPTTEVGNAVLEFGLSVSTPMLPPVKSMDSNLSSASKDSAKTVDPQEASRPPRAPHNMILAHDQRESGNYTPAGYTLSKNPHVDFSRDSPHTMRLTSDIDNLLLEDDDKPNQVLLARQQVFRRELDSELSVQSPIQALDEAEEEGKDSWMKWYIFNKDGGNASHRAGRPQGKARRSSGRRSRQGDLSKEGVETGRDTPQGLPKQQKPKPVRRTHGSATENKFSMGSSFEDTSVAYASGVSSDAGDMPGPRPLNFGGAFVRPSKETTGTFRRFVPLSVDKEEGSVGIGAGSTLGIGSGTEAGFSTSQARGMNTVPGQFSFFPATYPPPESFIHGARIHQAQGDGLSSHAPSFHPAVHASAYGAPSFGGPPDVQMTYHPMVSYPAPDQQLMASHPAPPFAPSHAQPTAPITFERSGWPHAMAYNQVQGPVEGNWHAGGTSHQWAPVNEYGYDVQDPNMVDPRLQTPSPQFPAWLEGDAVAMEAQQYPMQHQNIFMHGSTGQHGFTAVSVSPTNAGTQGSLAPMPVRATRAEQQDRKKNKKIQEKGQGKGTRKKAERKQGASDKSKTKDFPHGKKVATGSPKKKKKHSEFSSSRPDSKVSGMNQEVNVDGSGAPKNMNPEEAKRAELVESPATRSAFKEFYREFRARERSSLTDAESYAFKMLTDQSFPQKVHWRVYLELADLAKRTNRFDEARKRYGMVCRLQPYASQGWLEYSKLEEECGEFQKCSEILHRGLECCELSENLLTRAIKHEEKMGKPEHILKARQLLARVKHSGIEKVWRIVLEGAMMEARVGRSVMARKVLKVLMHHVPWYGPLYLEAFRLERDLGKYSDALTIVDRGLSSIPRYGPLWFGAFRICEMLDAGAGALSLPRTTAMFDRASTNISRELTWKVHLEAAQIYERNAIQVTADATEEEEILANNLILCRERFAMTVLSCPPNLSWKVWLASGRMELSAGHPDKARSLFLRAAEVVPEKGRVAALLECARLEEFIGKLDLARALLCEGRSEVGSDWKVWLESVLLEVRSGNCYRAIDFAKRGLEIHNGTGRLWAALVQLRHYEGGEDAQYAALKRALHAVPKSGEVWCEAGRIHMNPFCKTFDLDLASLHLFFATRFTPQYGDSFLEAVKRELLEGWMTQVAFGLWKELLRSYTEKIIACRDEGGRSDIVIASIVRRTFRLVRHALERDDAKDASSKAVDDHDKAIVSFLRESLSREFCETHVDMSMLELRCANADPNYGPLWFHCRQGPIDTARVVIASGREIFTNEMVAYADIYVSAIVRRFAVIVALKYEHQSEPSTDVTAEEHETTYAKAQDGWKSLVEARLRSAPSLQEILNAQGSTDGSDTVLLESSVSGSDFITGVVELNKHMPLEDMSPIQKRKTIFGSDALFS